MRSLFEPRHPHYIPTYRGRARCLFVFWLRRLWRNRVLVSFLLRSYLYSLSLICVRSRILLVKLLLLLRGLRMCVLFDPVMVFEPGGPLGFLAVAFVARNGLVHPVSVY